MFSDRLWLLKGAAALGLLACLGIRSHRVLSELHPEVELAAIPPESLREKTLYLWAKRVDAPDASSFEISTRVGPMRVLTSMPPPAGAYVTFTARVLAPRTLEAITLHINEGYGWKRPLNYAISILTVIGYLGWIRHLFRCRIEEGVFRSRY